MDRGLLHPEVLQGPLRTIARSLGSRDRASLGLACKPLNAAVLAAGGCECTVRAAQVPSFNAWLARMQRGGHSVDTVLLTGYSDDEKHGILTMLHRLALVAPQQLCMRGLSLGRAEPGILPLGASWCSTLRRLALPLMGSAQDFSPLEGMQLVSLHVQAEGGGDMWRPRLPRLTALTLEGVPYINEATMAAVCLDGVPSLRKLDITYVRHAAFSASRRLEDLSAITCSDYDRESKLSFPWQYAPALRKLDMHSNLEISLPGGRQLAALSGLSELCMSLPVGELPFSQTWTCNLTKLHLSISEPRDEAITQALGLLGCAQQLVSVSIEDLFSPRISTVGRWAWELQQIGPLHSLQDAHLQILCPTEVDDVTFEATVARQPGEGTAAMLGRLVVAAGEFIQF